MIQRAPLSKIKLNPASIVQEFPDLEGKPQEEIKRIGLERFEKHFNKLTKEEDKVRYLKEEMGKLGYTLKKIQKPGFRTKNIK